MASTKKKRKRSAAQKAATKNLVAMNKKKKRGGKKRSGKKRSGKKRSGKKRSGKKRSRATTVNPGLRTERVVGGSKRAKIAREVKALADRYAKAESARMAAEANLAVAKARASMKGAPMPKSRPSKKRRTVSAPKAGGSKGPSRKGVPHLSAAQVIKGASSRQLQAWICAGVKRTGCGGGKKTLQGSRVIGILR